MPSFIFWIVAMTLSWGEVSAAEPENTLKVAVMLSNGKQRSAFEQVVAQFEQANPGIKVKYLARDDAGYKQMLTQWLTQQQGVDILYWQAGERLYHQIRQGLVEPIDDVWQQQGFNEQFSQGLKNTVQLNGHVYAIPYSYYQWGFYYRRPLFERLKLKPPKTWEQLLKVCDRLVKEDIVPFTIGLKDQWPAAAWFDYINLRLNGLAFHEQLLQGKVVYTDPRVRSVFVAWKQLIDRKCFINPEVSRESKLKDNLPQIYHDKAAIILIGNFIAASIPSSQVADFDFFRFPKMLPDMPFYEEAPTDVFLLPKNSTNKPLARRFLAFIGQADVQFQLNEIIGSLPANRFAQESDNPLIKAGFNMLKDASGITQYFDRDANQPMAAAAMPIFADFFSHTDIERTLRDLETARRAHY